MKVVIVDYGMGNISSITAALKFLDVDSVSVSNKSSKIKSADKLILPGVGSFSEAMSSIKRLEIDKYLEEEVLKKKKPILGICLGMQLMCNSSSEHSHTNGLGFINGVIREFSESILSTPHIGFNQVKFNNNSRLFKGINNGSDFYFSHSFRLATSINISHSTCIYIDEFFASFEQDNIAGVQFHPELSQTNGLKLLKNFIEYF